MCDMTTFATISWSLGWGQPFPIGSGAGHSRRHPLILGVPRHRRTSAGAYPLDAAGPTAAGHEKRTLTTEPAVEHCAMLLFGSCAGHVARLHGGSPMKNKKRHPSFAIWGRDAKEGCRQRSMTHFHPTIGGGSRAEVSSAGEPMAARQRTFLQRSSQEKLLHLGELVRRKVAPTPSWIRPIGPAPSGGGLRRLWPGESSASPPGWAPSRRRRPGAAGCPLPAAPPATGAARRASSRPGRPDEGRR